jgi:hypothetical protein
MSRTRRWIWKNQGKGIAEVQISSWKYFGDFIYQEMQDFSTYVWRGQRCDGWKLESTLDRLARTQNVSIRSSYKFRSNHLEGFKYAARGRRGNNPAALEDENDWWALGQHHGLATPLLDWTTSPFVAAFFAYIEVGVHQTPQRTIYALHKPTVERKVTKIARDLESAHNEEHRAATAAGKKLGGLKLALLQTKPKPEIVFIRPLSDENQRLVSQGGLFTRGPIKSTIDTWIEANNDANDDGQTLIKILLPNRDREVCLRNLNRMNINHLSLFPDLYGASMFSNINSKIARY